MTLSPLDDFPIHQVPELMRHVASPDPNFFDRYYFNCHPKSGEMMLIIGMGQYPNLGVTDAFGCVRHRDLHRVVRASRELGYDRMNTKVGPFRVEVLEGLRRLRVVLEPNRHGLAFDLTWEGTIPATLGPRHLVRQDDQVIVDAMRIAQTGRWSGHITVGAERIPVDRWRGTRARTWGVGPIGEPEPPALRTGDAETRYWLYAPMQFDDHAILCLLQEDATGRRVLEEAVRVWSYDHDRRPERLGRPEYRPEYAPGTREVVSAVIAFDPPGGEPFEVRCTPVLPVHLMVGTGYGRDPDWRHGMHHGPDIVVQGVTYTLPEDADRMWGMVDAVGRFEYDGNIGYGLFEYWALGPHPSFA
jgi:hypothetical protein